MDWPSVRERPRRLPILCAQCGGSGEVAFAATSSGRVFSARCPTCGGLVWTGRTDARGRPVYRVQAKGERV